MRSERVVGEKMCIRKRGCLCAHSPHFWRSLCDRPRISAHRNLLMITKPIRFVDTPGAPVRAAPPLVLHRVKLSSNVASRPTSSRKCALST